MQEKLENLMFWWKKNHVDRFFATVPLRKAPTKIKPTEPKSPLEDSVEFCKWLCRRNFKMLGSGAFSTVHGKKGYDRVIKIGHRVHDDGWIAYALWANENGFGGNLAPKLYSFKKFSTFYVAIIERLNEVDASKKGDHTQASVMADLAYRGLVLENSFANNLCELVDSNWKPFYKGFKEQFKGCRIDWHGGNFMKRPKTGSFVLIDPLANNRTNTVKTTRWKAESSRPTTVLLGFINGYI